LIGIRDDEDNNFQFPKEEHLTKQLKDVLEENVDEKYFLSEKMLELITFQEKTNGEIANFNKGGERASVYDANTKAMSCLSATDYKQPKQIWIADYRNDEGLRIRKDNISPCMAARKHSETDISTMAPIIGYDYKIRRLTPKECFRLMDFSDSFSWLCSDSQAYKQAGNSIVVGVLEKIIKKLPL
jgi:DNA (cytosine-5)-methyltransferase 1